MTAQIVLMTGCSSGIGLATACRLVHDPDQRFLVIATVIAMSEKADLVDAVGDALDKTVFIKELDITEDEKIKEVVDDVIKTHGRIDILINVAGLPCHGLFDQISMERIKKVFGVNVIGTIRLTQAILPSMKQRKSGKIITISSTAGKIGYGYCEIYASTKFALEGFFESLAVSVRAFNISVCLIEPSTVDTGLIDEVKNQFETSGQAEGIEDVDRQQLTVMLNFLKDVPHAKPEDIAQALVTRCIDVEKPVLRHLLCDRTKEIIAPSVTDLTGEGGISISSKIFGSS